MNSLVIISQWVLHRHQLLWENPDRFDPRRFLPGARERIDRFAYLPFGVGPRVCIGASFSMQEAAIILAHLMRSFALSFKTTIRSCRCNASPCAQRAGCQ
jgi:cytochrome P450